MKNIKFRLSHSIVFLLVLSFVSAHKTAAQASAASWVGEYKYSHTEGETAGGASTLIEYTIVVSKKKDGLVARFTIDGYQSSDDYECRTVVQGNKLNLYVVRDLVDRDGIVMANAVKKGELLASLVKTTVRGKTIYLFRNGKYEIYPNNIASKYPVYFKKRR